MNLDTLWIITLLVTLFVIWKWYWKIQLMYGSSNYSVFTPDTFGITNEDGYKQLAIQGFDKMKRSTLVICTLVRDVAKNLQYIKKRSEILGGRFLDYRILIVENDSTDGTRDRLHEWREANPRVIILGCGVNSTEPCTMPKAKKKTDGHGVDRQRIEKMVLLRNIYIDAIRNSEELSKFDYCAVWDLDIIGSVYIDGVANSIGNLIEPSSPAFNADVICAYGIYRWGPVEIYYDTYAHVDIGDSFHIDLKSLHDVKKGLGVSYQRGEDPVKVQSGFGGFTIYQIPSLCRDRGIKYDMSGPDNLECEHVRLHKKFKNVYMNPSMVHLVLLNE